MLQQWKIAGWQWVAVRLFAVLITIAVASCSTAMAQQTEAFARAQHLKRGINLSMWYAQDHDLYNADGGAEKLATYITPKDFQLVHDLGFDHVRLSIDPQPLIADPAAGTLRPEAMARLDKTVQQITATGLVVVLDIHPETAWKHAVTMTPDGTKQFFAFWKSFAQHYAGTDPEHVYFEVLNEPEGVDPYRWAGEEARAVAIIRAQAPHHTIIATGEGWGGIDGLVEIEPMPDDNVIYSIHDYEPMEFTHQGATWAGDALKPLRAVPYPSTPENVAPLLAALPDGAAKKALASYGQQHWDVTHMEQRIGLAVAWAKARHVPLWCGEFGVYRQFAQPADRDRWIKDMRTTLEQDGIGWDMWDYQGGFALVTKKDGVTTVDEGLAKALGVGR
jgi:aryl-phospho-beta-D-glucosidase BglC (GH1 family)